MAIVVIIGCVILWAFIQASLNDQGIAPRSRGSLRYQRRKARKMGVDLDQVSINPRVPSGWQPTEPVGESHVSDLAWGLSTGLLAIVIMFVGAFVIMFSSIAADWVWAWFLFVIGASWVAQERRKARYRK